MRSEASLTLIEYYNMPQTLTDLLNIVSMAQGDTRLKKWAVMGIRKALGYLYNENVDKSIIENIKPTFIELLSANVATDMEVAKLLMYAAEVILTDGVETWEELFRCILGIYNPESIQIMDFVLEAFYHIIPYMQKESIVANLEMYLNAVSAAFQSNDPSLIGQGCLFLGSIIHGLTQESIDDRIMECFNTMLQIFIQFLQNGNGPVANKVAHGLHEAISGQILPLDAPALIHQIIDSVSNEGNSTIIPELYYNLFSPILDLIKYYGTDLIDEVQYLVNNIITFGAATFNESFFFDNEDCRLIACISDDIAHHIPAENLFEILYDAYPQNNDEATLIAYAIAYFATLETLNLEVVAHITDVISIADKVIATQNIYLYEIGIFIYDEIAQQLDDDQTDVSTHIIQTVLPLLQTLEPVYMRPGLSAIINSLNCTEIDTALVQPALTFLLGVCSNPEMHRFYSDSFEAIASLVFSAEDDIIPYAEELYQQFIQVAFITDPSLSDLQANAIDALALLLRFAGNVLGEVYPQAIDNIIQLGVNSEDSDIKNGVIIAIGRLMVGKCPLLENYQAQISNLIDSNFEKYLFKPPEDADNPELIGDPVMINSFANSMILIKTILKYMPQMVPEDNEKWLEVPASFMIVPYADIAGTAIKTMAYVVQYNFSYLAQFMNNTRFLIEELEYNIDNVCMCFKAWSRLLCKYNEWLGNFNDEASQQNFTNQFGEFITFLIEEGIQIITRTEQRMPDKVDLDTNSGIYLYRFFERLAIDLPDMFPSQKLIEISQKIKDYTYPERSRFFGVLRKMYETSKGSQLQTIALKYLLKGFHSNLIICDNTVRPEPLYGLYAIYQNRPAMLNAVIMNDITEIITNALESDYNQEAYFWTTNAISIAFLCSLMNNDPSFDHDTWIPLILKRMPLKDERKLCDHVYSTIFNFVQTENGRPYLDAYQEEFLRIIVQTFEIKERHMNQVNFSQSTFNSIMNIYRIVMQANPNAEEVMKGYFHDEFSLRRYLNRINPTQ